MAASSVITTTMLAIAGVTGDLATMLVGKTVAEARDDLDTIFALIAAGTAVRNGPLVSYTVDGQSATMDIAKLEAARDLIARLAAVGGGLSFMPVEWGA